MTTESEIKPCPFCGTDDEPFRAHYRPERTGCCDPWAVECNACCTIGPHAKTEAEAISRWNRAYLRAERDALAERVREDVDAVARRLWVAHAEYVGQTVRSTDDLRGCVEPELYRALARAALPAPQDAGNE